MVNIVADAIQEIRQELTSAMAQGEGQSLRFKPGPVELELQLEISREVGGSGGIKWLVVSANAEGKVTRASTHTVKLTLQPLVPQDKNFSRPKGVLLSAPDPFS